MDRNTENLIPEWEEIAAVSMSVQNMWLTCTANEIGCKTIGLSGKDGGEFNTLCDVNLLVNANDTPRIQEMHILIGHTMCHLIELEFSKPK